MSRGKRKEEDGSREEKGWVGGGRGMDQGSEKREEGERNGKTTFAGGGACRHNSKAMGQGLVLGFTGSTSLLPSAWAWCEL